MPRFLLAFALTGTVISIVLLPLRVLNWGDFRPLLRMTLTPGRMVVLGDSVIAAASRCDKNRASIPEMLSEQLRVPVLDGARLRRFDVVVIHLTLNGALFATTRADSDWERLWKQFQSNLSYASKPQPTRLVFKGRSYGDLGESVAVYFPKEKASATCPENAGADLAFVEFMYWRSYGQPLNFDAGYVPFLARVRSLQNRGATVLVVLPPVNYQLIERLNDPPVLENLRSAVAETETRLHSANIPVLNIAFALPSDAFADQWCGCGHLSEPGRRQYAVRVAEKLHAMSGIATSSSR
jgi:hypothetical protein